MIEDHGYFKGVLIAVLVLQVAMILYTLIAEKFNITDKKVFYIICYSALAVITAIVFPIEEQAFRKKNTKVYYSLVAIFVDVVYIWAGAITLIDSMSGTNLTTFSYVALALVSFVILEPWIFILDGVIFVTVLNFLLVKTTGVFYNSTLIASISIFVLSSLASTFNFYRRINSISLGKEIVDLNSILKDRAYFDDLTKLYNRRYLTERINTPLNYGIRPSAAVMMDLDNFKRINDVYGHQTGDIVLAKLGQLINENFPKENGYSVRYGGEEFLVYFKTCDVGKLFIQVENFRKIVENTPMKSFDGEPLKMTVSIGIGIAKEGQNYTGLINTADENLYIAKRQGKNKVVYQ